MAREGRIALYGNIAIPRGYCSNCEGYAFIIGKKLACCDSPTEEAPERFKRMSDCPEIRRGPSKQWRTYILRLQNGRCFYCSRLFGSTVYRNSKGVRLRVHWDHINPYVYSLDNRNQNFVAACHVCNGIKSSYVFRSLDEANTYIHSKWEEKKYSDVSNLRIEIHPETDIAKVL